LISLNPPFRSGIFLSALGAICFGAVAPAQAFQITPGTEETKALAEQFQEFVNPEGQAIDSAEALALDPARLRTALDTSVRAIFVNEGAAFRNSLKFSATNGDTTSGTVFEDLSGVDSLLPSPDAPLAIGDYVELGLFGTGTQFDFTPVQKGATGGTLEFGADPAENPDGLPHVVAHYQENYVILGFEDLLGGGDNDFNDAVVAIELSGQSAGAPEPTTLLGSGLAALGFWWRRRKQVQA